MWAKPNPKIKKGGVDNPQRGKRNCQMRGEYLRKKFPLLPEIFLKAAPTPFFPLLV